MSDRMSCDVQGAGIPKMTQPIDQVESDEPITIHIVIGAACAIWIWSIRREPQKARIAGS